MDRRRFLQASLPGAPRACLVDRPMILDLLSSLVLRAVMLATLAAAG